MREIFTGNISCISHNSANLQYYIHILGGFTIYNYISRAIMKSRAATYPLFFLSSNVMGPMHFDS